MNQLHLGQRCLLPIFTLHSVVWKKPSASATSTTPDEINSTASDTLLACGHTQKGNLIYIDAKKQDTRFSVCVFNAQSVGSRDKRTEIVKYICDECVDMFLTETWMRSHGDEAKYADLKPPGYSLRSFPRATRGGGLAVILRDNFPVTITTSFPFAHSSFELVKVTLTAPDHVHFFCLYRPPPSKRNKPTDALFLTEFPDFLEYCNLQRSTLLILGDFNMHFDCPTNPNTARILDILQTFNLEQAVSPPTHQRGHILDWILYREEERLLLSCIVKHGVSSDHLPVHCYLDVSRPKQQSVFQTTRNIRAINRQAFKADVSTLVTTLDQPTADQLND